MKKFPHVAGSTRLTDAQLRDEVPRPEHTAAPLRPAGAAHAKRPTPHDAGLGTRDRAKSVCAMSS